MNDRWGTALLIIQQVVIYFLLVLAVVLGFMGLWTLLQALS